MRVDYLSKCEGVVELPCLNYTSGIYFLINEEDEIVYIGQSVNVISRVDEHRRGVMGAHFCRILFLPIDNASKPLLEYVEAKFIERIRPQLNKQITPPRAKALKAPKHVSKILQHLHSTYRLNFRTWEYERIGK